MNSFDEYPSGPTPDRWRDNIYFYWWEFLRRNEGYIRHCEDPIDSEYSQLFEDFGDVRSNDFASWWERCCERQLFQPRDTQEVDLQAVQVIEVPPTPDELADNNFLYLKVSLQHSKRDLKGYFAEVLDTRHIVGGGVRYEKGREVKYPITGQPNINSLINLLKVHDLRRNNPKMALWRMAVELDLFQMEQAETMKDWKNVAAATVGRYLNKAKTLIKNVGQGRFPDYHSHKEWETP